MIKIPATSVDKVKIIGQMHHWFISVSSSANITESTCSSKNLTTFLLQPTHILFKSCQCFMAGWLAFSKLESQEIYRQW